MVKQCCATDGVEPQYIKDEILPEFFKHFWQHRMALDRRNYKQLVDTTVELANKVGASEIVGRVVDDLKDENEQYRKMVMETIEKVCVFFTSKRIKVTYDTNGLLYNHKVHYLRIILG